MPLITAEMNEVHVVQLISILKKSTTTSFSTLLFLRIDVSLQRLLH